MSSRRGFAAVFLLSALALALGSLSTRLKAQALQKSLYVSVVDQAGAPVPDIGPTDLIVREDNVSREILRIAPTDDPMQIAVLVDNSTASEAYISDIRLAVSAFATALTAGGRNEVAVIGLADRPTILADYTRDGARLQKGIERIWPQPESGSLLLDAIIEVTKGFARRGATRPVIVAVTTEGPELSSLHYDQVLNPLRDSSAAFYTFIVGPMGRDHGEDALNRMAVIEQGAQASGGHREQVLASSALTVRMKQLTSELASQYRVTYARPQSLIPPERVTVAATRAGLTARGTPIRDQQARP